MRRNFEVIKQALEEHLSAINENSSEIQALFDYLHQVEVKVDKLTQRLDQLQLTQTQKPVISSLNHVEKQIFLTLYTEESPISFKELSEKTDIPDSLLPECVSSLVQKGIPFQRSYFNNQLFLKLDPAFKERQAKENIVNLSLQSFME